MRILAVSPSVPATNAKGFQVQAYHRLRYLSRSHEVDVVCFGRGKEDEIRKRELIDLGIGVHMLPWRWGTAFFEVTKALFDGKTALQCALFKSSSFSAAIQKLVNETSPDAIHATTIRILPNLANYSAPLLLDLVDSMALNFRRRANSSPWWSRLFWMLEQDRVACYERAAVSQAAASFVVSSIDREEICMPGIHVLPLGIDLERNKKGPVEKDLVVVFTGNMAYRPNVEAAVWMAHNCWPKISKAFPNAKFVIAGNRPTAAVTNLASCSSINVTGRVPSMGDLISGAQVAVAPMQSGSGMQFKILEAMSCGVPVITTSLGLGDIRARAGIEVLVADTADDFVETVLLLLGSQELQEKIGKAGQRYVDENHTWTALNAEFEKIMLSKLY